jgi:hypothetical protein
MTTGVTTQHPFFDMPYITVTEYKTAPTSLDIDNLVSGGNAAAQDAELANVILRASAFMDEYLNQNLNASTQLENQRIRFQQDGTLALHAFNSPIISLQSLSYGTNPLNLTALADCSQVWFEDQQMIIPLGNFATSSAGPLSFGGGAPRSRVFVRYTYTSGYVNNLIAVATAGQTSFTMQDPTGIVANMQLRIIDGASSELKTVASNYVYGSTTVPITTALANNHANTVPVSNLPNAVKQACILITNAFLKMRGDNSVTMAVTTFASNNTTPGSQQFGSEIQTALTMLDLYRRVR